MSVNLPYIIQSIILDGEQISRFQLPNVNVTGDLHLYTLNPFDQRIKNNLYGSFVDIRGRVDSYRQDLVGFLVIRSFVTHNTVNQLLHLFKSVVLDEIFGSTSEYFNGWQFVVFNYSRKMNI